MITIKDVDTELHSILEKKLGSIGFIQIDNRKWVRHKNNGVFDLYSITAMKGASYSPCWGIGFDYFPIYKSNKLINQKNDKNKGMNLIIDPIDETGKLPDYHYSFLPELDIKVPTEQIENCVNKSISIALGDFKSINTIDEFYNYFEYRKQLIYKRFDFSSYLNHQLTDALLAYRYEKNSNKIQDFCAQNNIEATNKILTEFMKNINSIK